MLGNFGSWYVTARRCFRFQSAHHEGDGLSSSGVLTTFSFKNLIKNLKVKTYFFKNAFVKYWIFNTMLLLKIHDSNFCNREVCQCEQCRAEWFLKLGTSIIRDPKAKCDRRQKGWKTKHTSNMDFPRVFGSKSCPIFV